MPETPVQRWRAPVTVPLQALASALAGIAIAAVFFPVWITVPVAAALAVWGAGMCARRPSVVLTDQDLTVRRGMITRRVPVNQIEAVVLDRGKVLIGKADKGTISFYAWRQSRLDAWLKIPDIAGDVAHAISWASAASAAAKTAQEGAAQEGADQPAKAGAGATGRSGKNSPLIFLGAAGLAEIAAALVTRVSWDSPAMTAAGVIVALAFGFTGVGTLLFAFWTGLASRRPPGHHGRAGGPGRA